MLYVHLIKASLLIIDSRKIFEKEIVQGLIDGYQKGITPLPCSHCNRSVKFSEMLNWIKKNRPNYRIATGHYARIRYAETDSNQTNRNQLLKRSQNAFKMPLTIHLTKMP